MDEIRSKIKEWTQAIRLAEFHGIAEDIKNTAIVYPSDEINKAMYRLILYLCHTVQQCDKTNISNGINISNITCAVCSKLTSIPDAAKFFSGIYHIVNYLIDVKLYEDAMKLGDYLIPGSIFYAASINCVDMYVKFSSLWYKTIHNLLTTFQKMDEKQFDMIMMLINYELNFQVLSLKDGSKYLLNKITIYSDKIKSFGQQQLDDEFQNKMKNYIAHTKMSLGNENKFQTYRSTLRFLNDIILSKINSNNIGSITDRIKPFFAVFNNCMKEDKECYKCFTMYKNLIEILIRRVDEFTTEHFHAIKVYINGVNSTIQMHGNENAIKGNSYSIIQILEALILFWDKCHLASEKKYIQEEFMVNITTLIKHQGDIFPNFNLSECYCRKSDCRITVDIYNSVSIKLMALKMIARYIDNLSSDFITTIVEIAEECVQCIYDLQAANCTRWCKLWLITGSLIHNIAAHYEKVKYEETIRLYTLLVTVTIDLNAFDIESNYVSVDNPLCVSLHRLSNTHYFHGKYDDAMIACALNAYIGYANEKCKAFRFWTSIKYKYPTSHGIAIINCLRSNKDAELARIIGIDLMNCDLATICHREIKSLQEGEINLSSSITSVLDLMGGIDVPPLVYAQCVQKLGYHMLNFQSDVCISQYINKALFNLKQITKRTVVHHLLKGHLMFYGLIEDLKQMSKITKVEMQNCKIKLCTANDADTNGNSANNIVPAYNLINVKTAANMGEKIDKILQIWAKCYGKLDININEFLEPAAMVRTAIVAAEYTRFYQYHNLAIEAWTIAYELAKKYNNDSAIVYITGRCILSHHVNNEWIERAKSCIDKLSVSTDTTIIETSAMFKLSLSEFYFNIGMITEANKLFEEAVSLPDIKFTVNLATYLLSVDILLSHKFNFDYIQNIVKGLYTMLTIDDIGSIVRHRREELLYELDILFQFTNHVTLRMNSLISYREICAHLVRRLTIAQKLNAPLHVAECLKNLCFIDLSRHELENCEVKLQGLEHILMMETDEISMQSNFLSVLNAPQISPTSTLIIEPVRDVFQNDASPILRTKIFASPNFMNHNQKCKCFYCCNITYQYLVFSCTHIRAQLYSLQNHINHAIQHFYGAFNIIRKILNLSDINIGLHSYHDIVEYVLFMLDFARFLKRSVPKSFQDGLEIALHAVDMCEKHKIINSPVYLTANELIFEFRLQNVFNNIDYSKLTIPNIIDIDENEHLHEDNDSVAICTTPARTVVAKSVQSVRRKKTPPLLTLSKVTIDRIADNDGICMSSLRPAIHDIVMRKKSTRVRPIRREISEDDYSSNENLNDVESRPTSGKKSLNREITKKRIDNVNNQQMNQNQKNTRSGWRLRKKMFESSDESSEENENVDRVPNMMKKSQVSESSCSSNDVEVAKMKSNSETQLPLNSISMTISSYKIESGANHTNTPLKSSNGRKTSNDNAPLSMNFRSELSNTSSCSESNDELGTCTKNNVDSDDDMVKCSIEEPRRSRRLAVRTKKN